MGSGTLDAIQASMSEFEIPVIFTAKWTGIADLATAQRR